MITVFLGSVSDWVIEDWSWDFTTDQQEEILAETAKILLDCYCEEDEREFYTKKGDFNFTVGDKEIWVHEDLGEFEFHLVKE